jgi:catechol 2,3-dioxygenase-like lactoylglutathione lyase family enzyme
MSVEEYGSSEGRGFRPTMLFHPSHHVLDLATAEDFFARVFGRPSTSLASMMRNAPPNADHPRSYCTFTPINDLLMDSIDPTKYVLHGIQRYKTVEKPHLKAMGWYLDGMTELYREMKRHGYNVVSQLDEIAVGDDPPPAAGSPMPLYFTRPEEVGLRYEFMPVIPFPPDPRIQPGWTLPAVTDDDPLGLVRCSHHTILTDQPEREVRFWLEVMGAEVVHKGRDRARGLNAVYVHLAGTTLEFGVPDGGSAAHEDWLTTAPDDCYHAIDWLVVDLDRAERHLRSHGVKIRSRSGDSMVTDPETSLGVPWGFRLELVPGDPRI